MSRPLIIGIIGGIVAVVSVALTFLANRDETAHEIAAAPPSPASVTPPSKDLAAPARPSAARPVRKDKLEAPAAVVEPVRPSFDVVRINPRGDAVIAGRARPGWEVSVRAGEREIGRVKADKRGEWVLVPKKPLRPGTRELSLLSISPSGETLKSGKMVVVVVPRKGEDIAGRMVDKPSGSLALLVPRDGGGATTVLQKPAAEPAAAPAKPDAKLTLDAVDYDDKGAVSLSGKAPEGARVQVYLDNKLLGAGAADKSGVWRMTPDTKVATGLYRMRVDQIGRAGEVVARIETRFRRAEPLGDLPRDSVVYVQPGNSLWRIARRTYGSGIQYSVIYEANRNQIRNPSLIYPGQVFMLPKVN